MLQGIVNLLKVDGVGVRRVGLKSEARQDLAPGEFLLQELRVDVHGFSPDAKSRGGGGREVTRSWKSGGRGRGRFLGQAARGTRRSLEALRDKYQRTAFETKEGAYRGRRACVGGHGVEFGVELSEGERTEGGRRARQCVA